MGERRRWRSAQLTDQAALDQLSVGFQITGDGVVDARLWTAHTGTITLSRYDGRAARAERTTSHLSDILSDYIRLIVILRGAWTSRQAGRQFDAEAAHAMAMRFDQEFVSEVRSPDTDALEFYCPLSIFNAAGIHPDTVVGRAWKLSTLTLSAMEFVKAALDGPPLDDPIRTGRIDGILVHIVLLAVDDLRAASPAGATDRDDLRGRVITLIGNEFHDPALTSEQIAERLNVSPRSLFRAFEKTGITVNQLIRDTRLDRAAIALAEPGSTKTIAAIARSHGFSGADAFSRAFRLRFGESPSQFRRRTRSVT
jgi:AraC-like DNA-binding protein